MSDTTQVSIRKRFPQRVTTMLWGTLVAAFGAFVIADLNGYDFDLELAGIIALAALGAWILVAALMSGLSVNRD